LIHGFGGSAFYWHLRGVVRDRLDITSDEIDGGHCPALARPREQADRLDASWAELQPSASA
jgi:hypothetical protein